MSQALEKVKGVDSAFVTFSTKSALVTGVGDICTKAGAKRLLSALKKNRYGGKFQKLTLLKDSN